MATVRPSTVRQGTWFLAAGALNTCFGYAAFALFLWLTGSKELAVLLSTAAGIAFNFGTYGTVFARNGFGRLPHFIAFYLLLLAANILLLRLLAGAGMNPYFAQAIIIVLVTPISFVTMRALVFPAAPEARS
jgi:putative flippase GtrA